MENIEYEFKKNYLIEVLLKLDFIQEIDDLILNQRILNKITEKFPVLEKDKIINNQNIVFGKKDDPKFLESEFNQFVEKIFLDSNRSKATKLTNKYIIFSLRSYDSFSKDIKSNFEIIKELFNEYGDLKIRRIGLRYINQYDLNKYKYFNNFFDSKLVGDYKFSADLSGIDLIRNMSKMEFAYNDSKLTFQYGLYNPNYPAKLNNKQFVLDYDCYYENIIEDYREFEDRIIINHDFIKKIFNKSITQKLRNEMNE